MEEKVSIIMPNYNCERFIEETVNSVINQTYQNWELLIVDDCSTDNSVEIIKNCCNSDARIKLFINEKNSGAAASRNLALREATGKWIAFLDSDDLWTPDKLEKQIAFMEENGYKFSFTKYGHVDENTNSLKQIVCGPKKVSKRKMFRYCYLGCLTVMYDAECVGLIQISENVQKRNDYAMWLKVSKKATAYYLDEVLAYYRKRSGSISHQSKLSLIKYHYRLFRISENMNPFRAFYYTCKNLFFGFWKKIIYVKKGNF
jgi:glycosyltransferase involved in cell wall biosynthesis